jgi:Ulp1 family protease
LSCLDLLRTSDSFRQLLVDLPQKHFSSYAKALLAHYEAQEQNGTVSKQHVMVSKRRPDRFIGDRDPDHKLLNYPIEGADAEDIEAVAQNLTEAKGPPLARATSNSSPNLPPSGYITLRVKDYVTLAPGELRNDNIVNFWLCWYVTL